MALLEQNIKEMQQLYQALLSGKIKAEDANQLVALKLGILKSVDTRLKAHALGLKYGKKGISGIIDEGYIGNSTFIDMGGDVELEAVKCPDQNDAIITRAECLDYSGDAAHNSDCQSCKHYSRTRKLLLVD